MKGREIDHPDDLVIGCYVTVVRWIGGEAREPVQTFGVYGPELSGGRKEKRELFGEPLRVLAVSLPFVVVETLARERKTLDLRRAVLSPLDARFVRALRTKRVVCAEKTRPSSPAASSFISDNLRSISLTLPPKLRTGDSDDGAEDE